jgi:endonuclease YncB( thermonuclease family)
MRVIAVCIFFLSLSAAAAAEVVIHDGDTLTLDGTIYRLDGIDAPELVIWNASSPHYYRRALVALKGERSWRMQVGEAGQSRRWC